MREVHLISVKCMHAMHDQECLLTPTPYRLSKHLELQCFNRVSYMKNTPDTLEGKRTLSLENHVSPRALPLPQTHHP
jgi:hypothetical protein